MWNTPRPKQGTPDARSSLKRVLVVIRKAVRQKATREADVKRAAIVSRAGGATIKQDKEWHTLQWLYQHKL